MPVSENINTGVSVTTTYQTSSAYEDAFASTRRTQSQAQAGNTYANDPLRTQSRLIYNAGISKEAYFRSNSAGRPANTRLAMSDVIDNRSGLWKILQTDSDGNTPAAIDLATSLWSKTQAYKGMISASFHKEGAPATDDKAAAKTNPLLVSERSDGKFYGFQFHYNPGSVSLSYGGAPPVDVSLMASGREKFISYGTGAGAGSVGFNFILNRINDMKYFDPNTGKLKAGVRPNVFSGRPPSENELQDIYNRGTMYDMEFLFRTLLGYEYESALGRGMSWDKKTADLGWLGGKPVEIHLGKSLRYLGRVVNVDITHVLFTERMVPTFSEVSIGIQRIPDVTASQVASNSGAPTTTTGPNALIFKSATTYINGTANNTYTNEFGQTVNSPIFDGTFG